MTKRDKESDMTANPAKGLTPRDRAAKVTEALASLPAAIDTATTTEARLGPLHEETLAAWEVVEKLGATIHRQGRLLAGKKKGG